MSCSPIERLQQTLKVHVPGAGDDLLQLEMFNTIDEFFRRTNAWRQESEVQLSTEASEYSLPLPAGSEFVRMLGVTLNGAPVAMAGSQGAVQSAFGVLLPDLTFPDGDAEFSADILQPPSGTFTYALYNPTYVTVTGTPDAEQAKFPLKMLMALTVSKGCLDKDCGDWEGVPEWMHAMFFQEWLDGTLGRLYQMPSKPWSEATKAVYHHKRFRNAMAFRKQEAPKGFVYNSPGWHFPRSSGWI